MKTTKLENNIMVDLETMGQSSQAAIIAIGAVRFDRDGLHEEFYRVIDLQSSIDAGAALDGSTITWWLEQSAKARKAICRRGDPLETALVDFSQFVQQDTPVQLWGNGAAFDNVILANAYRSSAIGLPWFYYHNRCYRTVKNLHPEITLQRTGTHHNALDDARNQAQHLIDIFKQKYN